MKCRWTDTLVCRPGTSLARWEQGKRDEAETEFRAGALWELRNEPNPQVVNVILERVQGPQRAALNRFRGRE